MVVRVAFCDGCDGCGGRGSGGGAESSNEDVAGDEAGQPSCIGGRMDKSVRFEPREEREIEGDD